MNALLFLLSEGCRFCCCRHCSPPLLDPPNIDGALSIPGSFLLLHSHRLPSSLSIINPLVAAVAAWRQRGGGGGRSAAAAVALAQRR